MDKKGTERLVVATVVEFVLLLLIVGLITIYIARIASNDTFEKKFLAKDLGLFTDGIYASPNKLVIRYPQDTQDYSYEFREYKVYVYKDGPIKESYPFAGELGIDFKDKVIKTPNVETDEGKSLPLIFERTRKKIEPFGGILIE